MARRKRPDTLLLATHNKGKIREFKLLLKNLPLKIKSLEDYPEAPEVLETGQTFFDNAFKKAYEISKALNVLALADDSGLEVDALDGAPGIYSARYAGVHATDEENYMKLLEELRGVPFAERTARFRCVIVVCDPSGAWLKAEGSWEGFISFEPKGTHGFGYDPVFLIPEIGLTAAQIPLKLKNQISHRANALRELLCLLPTFLKIL